MKRLLACVLATILLGTCGCSGISGEQRLEKAGYTIDRVTINAGIEKPVKIVIVNDLHLQINNEEIAEENRDFMNARIAEFSIGGVSAQKRWEKLPGLINKTDADYVAFIGDMADFNSKATTDALREGFSKLDKPFMYLRSDHDFEGYWQENSDYATLFSRQAEVCDFDEVYVEELDEVVLVGINMSQNNISQTAFESFKSTLSIGKPVIVFTHVPFAQNEGDELKNFSEKVRDGRRLYWGSGAIEPSELTQRFMDIIYLEDSPVVAVFAAHLHDSTEVNVSSNAIEHIFAPCYMGNIGIVTIE